MKGVLLAILVSACATTNTATSGPPGATARAAGGEEQVCQEVSRPGSLMTRTECRPKSEVDDDRENMRTWMATPKAAAASSTSTPKAAVGTGR